MHAPLHAVQSHIGPQLYRIGPPPKKKSTRKDQENGIKIYPRIIKKLPQMASRGTLQAPSEPLGAPFGHTPYFKTLLDVIFCHFGSTLASLGAAFRRPLGLLSLSWTLQEPKIDEF